MSLHIKLKLKLTLGGFLPGRFQLTSVPHMKSSLNSQFSDTYTQYIGNTVVHFHPFFFQPRRFTHFYCALSTITIALQSIVSSLINAISTDLHHLCPVSAGHRYHVCNHHCRLLGTASKLSVKRSSANHLANHIK